MFLCIPDVLTENELDSVVEILKNAKGQFVDGRATTGARAGTVKKNLQLTSGEAHVAAVQILTGALSRNQLFLSAALPKRFSAPLFNRYDEGMEYGYHVDNAIMGAQDKIRTDLSATLFLSDPKGYDGGALLSKEGSTEQSARLNAGSMALYPSTTLHRVTQVTRGTRLAAIFWVQSFVRDAAKRQLLFDLDLSVAAITKESAATTPMPTSVATLHACYANLYRMWAEV